ncbi:hypothetical protein SAMN05192559_101672 [Halobacillus karajensis]|uniref:hypothetical protein n=1 Tax=Halobacillus karajensis TaxID=195088 RepID=UPI0008A7F6C0|nr:hypothetical protein [Halobacillus karajensis]SEH47730.1 hypothetical protein SAMN05192559_101672 [Halobacillus karajensis]
MKILRNGIVWIALAVVSVIGIAVYSYYHYNFSLDYESQQNKEWAGEEKMEPQKDDATTEDLLVKLLRPKINKIVKNKEGGNVHWTWNKIESLYYYDHLNKGTTISKDKDWFELTASINVSSKTSEDPLGKRIQLKITPPSAGENISDTTIQLIGYQ